MKEDTKKQELIRSYMEAGKSDSEISLLTGVRDLEIYRLRKEKRWSPIVDGTSAEREQRIAAHRIGEPS